MYLGTEYQSCIIFAENTEFGSGEKNRRALAGIDVT